MTIHIFFIAKHESNFVIWKTCRIFFLDYMAPAMVFVLILMIILLQEEAFRVLLVTDPNFLSDAFLRQKQWNTPLLCLLREDHPPKGHEKKGTWLVGEQTEPRLWMKTRQNQASGCRREEEAIGCGGCGGAVDAKGGMVEKWIPRGANWASAWLPLGAKAWVTEEEEKRCWQMLAGVLAGDRRSILPSDEHLLCKAIGWWNNQFSGATFCIFENLLLVMLFLFHNSVPRLIWRKHNWILYCQIFLSPDKALYLYSTTGTSKDRVCCKGIVGRSCWSPGFPSCSAPRSSSWRRGWTAAGSRWSRNWQGPTRTQTVSDLV